MKKFLYILMLILPLSLFAQRGGRKFTPIYGNDTEINKTLAFVTDNFIFDSLTYTRIANLKGFSRCTFNVDTSGRIINVKITKSIAYWLDYEIITAMNKMPNMEPFTNKNGEKIQVKRDVYFTFNNNDNDKYFDRPGFDQNTQADPSIEKQRQAIALKNEENRKEWDKFSKDNTKLSLDGKSIYKPGVLPNNPLKINTPPPVKPPINLTITKAE